MNLYFNILSENLKHYIERPPGRFLYTNGITFVQQLPVLWIVKHKLFSLGYSSSTTQVPAIRFRYTHTRKPFFRSTTQKLLTPSTVAALEQFVESGDQQVEEGIDRIHTTELSDIVAALQGLQQAPLRSTTGQPTTKSRYRT